MNICAQKNTNMSMGFPVTANIYSFYTSQRNNSREGVIKDVCHPRYRTLGCAVIYIRKYVGKDLLMIVIFSMYLVQCEIFDVNKFQGSANLSGLAK